MRDSPSPRQAARQSEALAGKLAHRLSVQGGRVALYLAVGPPGAPKGNGSSSRRSSLGASQDQRHERSGLRPPRPSNGRGAPIRRASVAKQEAVPAEVGEPQLGAGVGALVADDHAHPLAARDKTRTA